MSGALQFFIYGALAVAAFKALAFGVNWLNERRDDARAVQEHKRAGEEARAQLVQRYEFLETKYGDEDVVARIIAEQPWVGMSAEQLSDSLGPPEAVDERSLKSVTRYTFKYGRGPRNSFVAKFYIEDDKVTGWDIKDLS